MSDDLVERLRNGQTCDSFEGTEIMTEAADRIDQLQEIIVRIQYTNLRRDINRAERTREIDRLCKGE